jgi:hypothetical protein
MKAKLFIRPSNLKGANAIIEQWHRHHKPVVGCRFCIKVVDDEGVTRGVAIVGRPKARMTDQENIAEVDRVCTDGTPNACSALYGGCARIAREMGFESIQTFILVSEPGVSLKASGWKHVSNTDGSTQWSRPSRERQTTFITENKQKWELRFREGS